MYKYRGVITALFFVALLVFPAASSSVAVCVGVVFFIAAFCLRVWARMHIGEHSRGSELACPIIVKTGPYKYVNHPLYISNFMAGTSFALFHTGFTLETIGFCAIYGTFLEMLAINENKFLKQFQKSNHPCSSGNHGELPLLHAITKDRYTWLWQMIILTLIFLPCSLNPLRLL